MNDLLEIYFTESDRVFRQEVRDFIRHNLPPEVAQATRNSEFVSRELIDSWQRALARKGWASPAWPVEYGGTGWTPVQRFIFAEECDKADAPAIAVQGLAMVAPVIYTYGTPAQKARYLPRIATGEDFWCQGFSEPGSGSDLASLRTKAQLDGDHYVVNGSKIWTSSAHHADMMFCLVRTDPQAKAQKGISFILIDMRTPGIEVRPIVSIDGSHHLNEVFFDNVRVPCENLIGEENLGWTYAKFLLGNERSSISDAVPTRRRLNRLKAIAASEASGDGGALVDAPVFAHRLAGLEIELLALTCCDLNYLRGDDTSPISPSLLKLRGSEVLHSVAQAGIEALGPLGMPYEGQADGSFQSVGAPAHANGAMQDYLFRRAATIYGGSSETQKNIVAKSIFGF